MVSFKMLWDNHPANQNIPVVDPCRDKYNKSAYTNQCAIRMGIALQLAGISIGTYSSAFCQHGHGRTHILRAQELADWLKNNSYIAGKPSILQKVTTQIIAVKNVLCFSRLATANDTESSEAPSVCKQGSTQDFPAATFAKNRLARSDIGNRKINRF